MATAPPVPAHADPYSSVVARGAVLGTGTARSRDAPGFAANRTNVSPARKAHRWGPVAPAPIAMEGLMKANLVLAFIVGTLLLVAGCASAPGDSTPVIVLSVSGTDAVRFLPPLGDRPASRDFWGGAAMRIRVTDTNGVALKSDFSVADGSIAVRGNAYAALWRVKQTTAQHRGIDAMQIQVWIDDSPKGMPCLATDGTACLGATMDVRVARRGGEVNASSTVPIRVFVSTPAPSFEPTSLGDLHPLAPTVSTLATVENCPVDEFTMPGQGLRALGSGLRALGSGLRALGSVGGLFLIAPGGGQPSGDGQDLRLEDPTLTGSWTGAIADVQFPNDDGAILVVDDFAAKNGTGLVFDIGGAYLTLAGITDGQDLQDAVETTSSTPFSHGALVMHQLGQMLEGAGFGLADHSADMSFRIYERGLYDGDYQYGTARIVLAGVDTSGYDTDVIAERTARATHALEYLYTNVEDASAIPTLAINMSFAIVPCGVLDDFNASNFPDFESYVAALGADNDVAAQFDAQLEQLVLTPTDPGADPINTGLLSGSCDESFYGEDFPPIDYGGDDPFGVWNDLVTSDVAVQGPYCTSSRIIVASSGNFGLSFPLYPAAFPSIVSASAQSAIVPDGYSTAKSWFANDGEVMAPGALYVLGSDGTNSLAYAGTSFSAPVVTLFTALDQTRDPPRCALGTTSKLAHGTANDAALPDAANTYCGEILK